MRRALLLFAAAMLSSGCAAPAEPDGWRLMDLGRSRSANKIHVAPSGGWIAVESSGPDPVVVLLDGNLKERGRRGGPVKSLAFEKGAQSAVLVDGEQVQCVGIPDLEVLQESTAPGNLHLLIKSVWRQVTVPDGWLLVTWEGHHEVNRAGPRIQSTLRPTIERPLGGAFDERTGLLVLIGGGQREKVELFDLTGSKQTIATLDVGDHSLRFDVAVHDGRAWLAQSDGTALLVDLNRRAVEGCHRLAEGRSVSLALSQSGGVLATTVEVPSAQKGPPTVRIGLWEVRGADLRLLAEGEFPESPAVRDIAVLTDDRTVLVAAHSGLWIWRPVVDAPLSSPKENPAPGAGGDDSSSLAPGRMPTGEFDGSAATHVPVAFDGDDLHLEVHPGHFVSTSDSGPPMKARCTIYLCRADGQVAGPAAVGAKGRSPESPQGGWTAEFVHREEAELLFRRESDGMFWRVVVVPDFTAEGIRWSAKSAYLMCIR